MLGRIFSQAHQGMPRVEFLRHAARALSRASIADGVEVWLRERDTVYRCLSTSRSRGTRISSASDQQILKARFPPGGQGTWNDLCRLMLLAPVRTIPVRGMACWTADGTRVFHRVKAGGGWRVAVQVRPRGPYCCAACVAFLADGRRRGLIQLKWRTPPRSVRAEMEGLADIAMLFGEAFVSRQMSVALRERIKELRCLYDIATIAAQREQPLSAVLQSIAAVLPRAFLHPAHAAAQIVLDDTLYRAGATGEPCDRLRSRLPLAGNGQSCVEVAYCTMHARLDEGPFLQEERQLLDTVAREIALVVERKRSEEENARLQDQVRHADRLTMVGQLAATVAHELNEPLESILGFGQLLSTSPAVSGQTRYDSERVVQAALHARGVLRELMTLARRTGGERIRTNLNAIVEESLWYVRPRCRRGGVELVLDTAEGPAAIVADPVQLHQVVINLAVNAIQAMPGGGRLTLRTRAEGDNAVLSVIDTGVGMSTEVRRKIFTPFFTTKGPSEGTGLGLTVVQGIVQGHGGSIDVHSVPLRGSTFEVRLPAAAAPSDKRT